MLNSLASLSKSLIFSFESDCRIAVSVDAILFFFLQIYYKTRSVSEFEALQVHPVLYKRQFRHFFCFNIRKGANRIAYAKGLIPF
jgi:hypothetical protein